VSPHAATFGEALDALLCMTSWAPGARYVDLERSNLPSRSRHVAHSWFDARGPARRRLIADTVRRLDERYSPEITMCLPRKERGWGSVTACTVLWARVEGSEQIERARAFSPSPSLVLQDGGSSRRLLLWALARPLGWSDTVRANKRLAYALHAVQKWSDPEELRIPVPGTCLRMGRSRPVPVRVGRLSLEMFTPRELVGQLKDPPENKWWENVA
jgi:hypothetical protein